jgi:uncharacterized protein with NAD-binding domain and iron-sulfur cluster
MASQSGNEPGSEGSVPPASSAVPPEQDRPKDKPKIAKKAKPQQDDKGGEQSGGRLPKIVIIGGGVAGLSAAHELQERGFAVTVYERRENKKKTPENNLLVALGGKARSFLVESDHAYGWPNNDPAKKKHIVDLPAEHGFHFFPGFYQHIVDTFRRIPLSDRPGKFVSDNLVKIEHAAYAREDRPFFRFATAQADTVRQYWKGLRRVFLQNPSLGLSTYEAAFAASKLVNAMTMCDERREAELDAVSWADYMDAREMSDAYRTAIIDGLTQNFVAMDSRLSSARTSINILARLLHDMTTPGRTADRVLNGPMNEAWIDPWRKYLMGGEEPGSSNTRDIRRGQKPVEFKPGEVGSFSFDAAASRITGINLVIRNHKGVVISSEGVSAVEPTEYILAVPVEAARTILNATAARYPQIFEHAPALKWINDLVVSWMAGIMFYLKKDVEMCPGHIVYLNSRWAITSISQNQFWRKQMPERSNENEGKDKRAKNPAVGGILSVILSDWDRPGFRNRDRTAKEAQNANEIAHEAMAQIRAHVRGLRTKDATKNDQKLQQTERELEDGNIVGFTLGTAITLRPDLLGPMSTKDFGPRQERMNYGDFPAPLHELVEALKYGAPDKIVEEAKNVNRATFRSGGPSLTESEVTTISRDLEDAAMNPANHEPLFINTVNSWSKRPTATTAISNLYLAADYIKTNTDMGTMEAANEAARRAVNSILDALDSKRARCKIFSFEEPAVLAPFKAIDKHLFNLGLPHPSFLVDPLLAFGAKFSKGLRGWTSEDYDGAP